MQKLLDGIAEKNGKAIQDAVKTEIEAATAGLMKADELGAKLEAAGISAKEIKTLTEAVEKQGIEMRKFFEKGNQVDSLEEQLEKVKKDILDIPTSGRSVKLTLPSKFTAKTTVETTAVSQSTLAYRVPGVAQLPHLRTVIRPLFRNVTLGPGNGGIVRYVDQAAITRSAAPVEENPEAGKPQSAISWIERSQALEVIADTIPVSKQAWRDFDYISSELDRLLNINLQLKVDQQLWSGNNTPPQLNGVYTAAPTFNAGAYSGLLVPNATIYDLLAILKVQVFNNKQSKYMPQTVVMNPADILRYKLAKGSDGHYVLPPFISADGNVIDGMRVIESSQVTANTLLIGDFMYGTVFTDQGVTVEFGHIDKQFIQNTFTILAEERLLLLIRNVDADAFLKVTNIDAAVTAITDDSTPSV